MSYPQYNTAAFLVQLQPEIKWMIRGLPANPVNEILRLYMDPWYPNEFIVMYKERTAAIIRETYYQDTQETRAELILNGKIRENFSMTDHERLNAEIPLQFSNPYGKLVEQRFLVATRVIEKVAASLLADRLNDGRDRRLVAG